MRRICLECSSVTYAQKGQRLLSQAGIGAWVRREAGGCCSWCIEVAACDERAARKALREGGVRVLS